MDTSLSNALAELFSAFAQELSAKGIPPGRVDVYLFGGCAVHLYTSHRTSSDVDVELVCPQELITEVRKAQRVLPAIDFEDPDAGPMALAFDLTFNPTLGPLHEDYIDRATVWGRFGGGGGHGEAASSR